MTDPNAKPFDFSAFVPGFDFLKNLASGSAGGSTSAMPGIPGVGSWVAPTLSVEEVDKRIQELKAVQFWLDQNMTALKATIQALEVQKMTLSTLKGMNVRMEDLASAFTSSMGSAKAQPVAASSSTAPAGDVSAASASSSASASGAGVVDPLQWWGALTQQFEQIAGTAMRDAAHLKVPSVLQAIVEQTTETIGKMTSGDMIGGASADDGSAVARKKPSSPRKRAPAAKRTIPRKR